MKPRPKKAAAKATKEKPHGCGPRCSNNQFGHWCPPSAIGSCAVFKGRYLSYLEHELEETP